MKQIMDFRLVTACAARSVTIACAEHPARPHSV
jgi:hypothetical protein